MWRKSKLLHMWRNFRFLHICHAYKFDISPHDKFFSTYLICDICDKYEVWMYTAVVNWGDTICYLGTVTQYSIAVIQDDSVQCNVLIEDDVARWGDTGWCSAALNTLARVICSYYRLSAATLPLWNVGYIYNCLETSCIVVVLFALHVDSVHPR